MLAGESAAERRFKASQPKATLAGFAAAVIAVLLIAALSYRALSERTEAARRVTDTFAVTQRLEMVLSLLKDAETGQRGYLLTRNERYLEPYHDARVRLPQAMQDVRQRLQGDLTQTERMERFEWLAQQKLTELDETIQLYRTDPAAALDLVNSDRGRDVMDKVRTLVAQLQATEQQQLLTKTRDFERSQWWSTVVMWGGSALLLGLISVAWLLSARDSLQQQIQGWLQSGQNELGSKLWGDQTPSSIGETVTSFIARHLDAKLVAVYLQARDRKLQLAGTWGLAEGAAPARSNLAGRGLNEQAFKENRPILAQNVPEDYFAVSSGFGSARPRHLIVAPTTSDGVPNGIIELGFFRLPEPYELEFLARVAETVGIAFRSARARAELQDALEETQRQAEELQAQQEELRTSNEELEQQSNALLHSQTQLQNQQAELEQINSNLEEQTQSLERQKNDLTHAQEELQRVNTYKSEFLANMSHELRTPLNSSLILSRLLRDNREGNLTEQQVNFADTIYSAGNDLLTLINDILDLSKIEAGKLDIRPENVSLLRVVNDLQATFLPVAKEKRLALTIDVESGLTIYTDSTRLLQILRNLLSNALKFTEQGWVALKVTRTAEGRLAFAVTDTGIGIPAAQHDVVFEAFRQADGTTNRRFGGTGLGLSISSDLAGLLGGELTLESAPGRGSTFTLFLPQEFTEAPKLEKEAPQRAQRQAARAPDTQVGAPPPAPRPMPGAAAAAFDDRDNIAYGTRSVLVIEDDVPFARIVQDLAHELDFQALVAQSAEEGLAMAERYRPSAIVLDIGLPDRSGLTVLDALKHNPSTRHVPVHIVSGADHRQAALEMGATGYAVKPIQREHLAEALKRLETKFLQKLRRVLVVEDNDAHRNATCQLLALDSVETVPATSAAQALELLSNSTFDCMVLDLSLPDKSGFELLEEMSQKDQYSFPPVIVYTGRSLSREEEQRLRRYSNSIIVKGARSPERLLDEVTLFLHQVESELPPDRQRMLRQVRNREAVFEGRRVLIVEDDIRNVFALTSVLEPKGAKVEVARNGREALNHLRTKPGVDLVLMDIMMPEMDGLEATREIRKQPALEKLPIIALTAKAMSDDRENCIAAGANDYIAKPLDIDKLLSLARVWMPK